MKIGQMIAAYREVNRYSVREMAKVIGVSAATLNRVERDGACDSKTLAKILNWSLS